MPPSEQTTDAAPRSTGRRGATAAAIVAVVALAWWARAAPLGPGTLWLDDLWVVAPSAARDLGDAGRMLVTTPGFTVVVNAVHVLGGRSSTSAQALPFAAGVLGTVVAWAAARSMQWRWPAALVTALVVAVAPEHVVHSTRVKQYTLEAALGFAAVALAWRVVRRGGSAWPVAALAAGATLLSASAGVYAGSVLAAVTLLQLLDRRAGEPATARLRSLVAPALAFGAFAVAWWALYLRAHVPDGLRDYWREDFLDTGGPGAYLTDLGASLDRLSAGLLPLTPAWALLAVAAATVVIASPRLGLILGTPVAAAVVLATLDLAPLGTGRTDIHLLPSAALAVGGAVELIGRRVPRSAPLGAAALTGALVIGFVARDLRPTAYPPFDVRPLIEEADRDDRGTVVVYPATRWAWAVYGDGGFEPVDAANETGFDVRITDPDVAVLAPHRHDPERYGSELARVTAGADRVTFVASHWRDDIVAIEAWFADGGWDEVRRLERPGARLVEWRRR